MLMTSATTKLFEPMSDISNRNLAQSMRLMAWERAKGELRGLLHTYWPDYSSGNETNNDQEFRQINEMIEKFISQVDDSIF
jgi:hypothetical protein